MVRRIAEVEHTMHAHHDSHPAEEYLRPARTPEECPLGLGLTYPIMFIAYDVEHDRETPLSGLMHEDDPNLIVVSLVAEAIAEEARYRNSSAYCGRKPAEDHTGCPSSVECFHATLADDDEHVMVMEVWA